MASRLLKNEGWVLLCTIIQKSDGMAIVSRGEWRLALFAAITGRTASTTSVIDELSSLFI